MRRENPKPEIPFNKSLRDKAREMRDNPTPAENLLLQMLRQSPMDEPLNIQRKKPLGEYIVDFYCRDLDLVIEVDEGTGEDSKRGEFLKSYGLQVIRFTPEEILDNMDQCNLRLVKILQDLMNQTPNRRTAGPNWA